MTRAGWVIGPYGTYSHSAIIPTLLAACGLACFALLILMGEAVERDAPSPCDWLSHVAARMGQASEFRIAAAVFVIQLLLLMAMESAEQTVAFGHPLGFTASLGSPPGIVLAAHAIAALIVVSLLMQACRGLTLAVRAIANAMRPILRLSARETIATPSVRRLRIEAGSEIKHRTPLARRIASRPPPAQLLAVA